MLFRSPSRYGHPETVGPWRFRLSEIGFPDQLGSLRSLEIEYLTGFTLPLVLKRAERCGLLFQPIERFASKANFMVKPNEQLVTVS